MSGRGRFLRPDLPLALQERLLLALTSSAARWHRPAELQVVKAAGAATDSSDLMNGQVVYLSEPHGAGNGILAAVHHITASRALHNLTSTSPTPHSSPVILGSKNVCLVPFLAELTWLFVGASGFEFAETVADIERALSSQRDVTLVPSGFSTIGTGGNVDWRRRRKFFDILKRQATREGRTITVAPILWFYELACYDWYLLGGSFWEEARVKARLPLGVFAVGYPAMPWLPKRVPMLIGEGRCVEVEPESEEKEEEREEEGEEEEEEEDEEGEETASSSRVANSRNSSMDSSTDASSTDASSTDASYSPFRKGAKKAECSRCSSKFTVFNRRHHCRSCAASVCGRCSAARLVVRARAFEDGSEEGEPVRVCDECKEKIKRGAEKEEKEEKEEEAVPPKKKVVPPARKKKAKSPPARPAASRASLLASSVARTKSALGASYLSVFSLCRASWNASPHANRKVEEGEWNMRWEGEEGGGK